MKGKSSPHQALAKRKEQVQSRQFLSLFLKDVKNCFHHTSSILSKIMPLYCIFFTYSVPIHEICLFKKQL